MRHPEPPPLRPLARDRAVFAGLARVFVGRTTIAEGADVLETALAEPTGLVIVLNHGPAHAPLVPLAALAGAILDAGGDGRRMLGVTFRALYAVPGLRRLVVWLTQATSPPGIEELVAAMRTGRCTDVVIMPEGQNCVVGDPSVLKPFASPRFVEVAFRTGASILLAVHHGTERWATRVAVPPALPLHRLAALVSTSLGHEVERQGALSVPHGFERIPELRLGFALHRPSLDAATFEALPPERRGRVVAAEAAAIHARMAAIHAKLGAGQSPASAVEPEAQG